MECVSMEDAPVLCVVLVPCLCQAFPSVKRCTCMCMCRCRPTCTVKHYSICLSVGTWTWKRATRPDGQTLCSYYLLLESVVATISLSLSLSRIEVAMH